MDPQIAFDQLVSDATRWFLADAHSEEERELERRIEEARRADEDFANAAIAAAAERLSPGIRL
jgi:hypothetical protein